MRQQIDGCQLEIDSDRGVIYVHGPHGFTLLRICGLPRPIPEMTHSLDMRKPVTKMKEMLDISCILFPKAYEVKFSWKGKAPSIWDAKQK